MNEFANLLSAFVKEKGVKIQPFARYCGYDRANMYKILKGQRNLPGREIVEKAAKYMHLLPSEEEELWEAYKISAQGSDNYYRRKEVQKFFTEPILSSNVNVTALTEGANYVQTECQFRYCGTAIPFLTVRSTAR